jgi:hypothetical protein
MQKAPNRIILETATTEFPPKSAARFARSWYWRGEPPALTVSLEGCALPCASVLNPMLRVVPRFAAIWRCRGGAPYIPPVQPIISPAKSRF